MRVVADPEGSRLWVSLEGREIDPGHEVLEIALPEGSVRARIPVGSSPQGMALHPSGRWLLVAARFSNYLSVIETSGARVVADIEVPFYCEDLVVSADGRTLYASNSWKDQVLVVDLEIREGVLSGRMRDLGMGGRRFTGEGSGGHPAPAREPAPWSVLKARCGSQACHMFPRAGFVAGTDPDRAYRSALAHLSPGDPEASVLLRIATPAGRGGLAGLMDHRDHPGGPVFEEPDRDPDYQLLHRWIAEGVPGPGVPVGSRPRDLLLAPDGSHLFVANTGSLDVSVLDLTTLRQERRIAMQSPVNDLAWDRDGGEARLVMATLGIGSGHPAVRDPVREGWVKPAPDTRAPERRWSGPWPTADMSEFRSPDSARVLGASEQDPLGPFDAVDGTVEEGPRDVASDLVVASPRVASVLGYRADEEATRYTSDSQEALPGDVKGAILPGLMKVAGSFPEQITRRGDRVFVTMAATNQVQEWAVRPKAPPEGRLEPVGVLPTGFGPAGVAVAGDWLVVADRLGGTLTLHHLASELTRRVALDPDLPEYPATDFERGEVVAETALFALDQDQSCLHCHTRHSSDGKRWSNKATVGSGWRGEDRFGGSREIPDLRALVQEKPLELEGVNDPYEMTFQVHAMMPLVDFAGETPSGDFRGVTATAEERAGFRFGAAHEVKPGEKLRVAPDVDLRDLIARRSRFLAEAGRRWFGKPVGFEEIVRLLGVWLEGESRLLPNPVDRRDPMVTEGRLVFESPEVGCSSCHPAPAFTERGLSPELGPTFPPVVSAAPRDRTATLVSARYLDRVRYRIPAPAGADPGRIERREGFYVAPSLRGLWARPPSFLHHGHAVSLREVLCTPRHTALRRFPEERHDIPRPGRWEIGQNAIGAIPDTHGGTSHLSTWEIECLLAYLGSIE